MKEAEPTLVVDTVDAARFHLLRAFIATAGIHRESGQYEIEETIRLAKTADNHLLEADAIVYQYRVADVLADPSDHAAAVNDLRYAAGLYDEADDEFGTVRCLNTLAFQLLWDDRDDEAFETLERAVTISTRNGDDTGLAWALVARSLGSAKRSRLGGIAGSDIPADLTRAIAIGERIEEHRVGFVALFLMGSWLQSQGDLDLAVQKLAEGASVADIRGDLFYATASNTLLADAERSRRNPSEAVSAAILALERGLTRSVEPMLAWVVEITAGIITDIGDPCLGARLIGAAEALRARLETPMPTWDDEGYQRLVADIKGLAGGNYPPCYAEGTHWTIAYAANVARDALRTSVEHLEGSDTV